MTEAEAKPSTKKSTAVTAGNEQQQARANAPSPPPSGTTERIAHDGTEDAPFSPWNVLGCIAAPMHFWSLEPGQAAPLCGQPQLSWCFGQTVLSIRVRLPQAASARPARLLYEAEAG